MFVLLVLKTVSVNRLYKIILLRMIRLLIFDVALKEVSD